MTGFDDNGNPVPVVWPDRPQDATARLLEALQDAGAVFPDVPAAAREIERAFDEAGDVRAAETLGIIFARLPGGRAGTSLRLALLQGADVSAREAKLLGVSKQVLHQSVARLRARLLGKTFTARPLVED